MLDFDFCNFSTRMQALTGCSAAQLRAAIMNGTMAADYETGRLNDAEFHKEICRRTRSDIPFDTFVETWNSIFLPEALIPDEILRALAQSCQLWALSNTNRIHFEFIRRRYSFVQYFRGYVLSHEVGAMKPDERIYTHALQCAGAAPAEALFVDDLPANVDAARKLGMDAFQFLNLEQFAQELRARNIRL